MQPSLKRRESHFEFGENWLSFLNSVNEERITEAVRGLERLFPNEGLRNRRFLDIGCGSGLSMLAALRLGAREVIGVDIDTNSVKATRECLSRFAPDGSWRVSCQSVFDLCPRQVGRFDVVYSWGVLHHTGDLWAAVAKAASMASNDGLLALALYRKTPFCRFWRWEKYIYSRLPRFAQIPIRLMYQAGVMTRRLTLGQNPIRHIRNYKRNRGMSYKHDMHDWLGGYPYESATPEEVREKLSSLGFRMIRENLRHKRRFSGLLGSGCNEYVARH